MRITVLLLCLGITGCLGPNVHAPDSFEDGTTLCGPTGCIGVHDHCLEPPDDWMAGYHPTMWDPLTQGDAMAMPWTDSMAPEEIVPHPATHDAVIAPREEDFDLDAMAPDVNRPNRLLPTNRLPHIAEWQQNEPSTATTTSEPETWPDATAAYPKTTQPASHDRKTLPYDEVFGPAQESDEPAIGDRSDHELSGPELAVSWDEAAESDQPAVSPQLDGILNEQNVRMEKADNFGGAPPVVGPSDVHRPAVDSAPREERETMVFSPPRNTVPADALRHANPRRAEARPDNMGGAPSGIVTTAAVVDHVRQGSQQDQHSVYRVRSVKQPIEQQMAGASPAGNRPAKTEGHPPAPRPTEVMEADEDISTTTATEDIEASATSGRTDAPPGSADRQQRLLTAIGQMIGESDEEATAF
ncbi:MAG: hypothetical protein ACC645_16405 [Pirellulales bacterium]